MTPPIYLSASPHLSDHAANSHDLDYTLGGKHTAAIFAIGHCSYCNTKWAIAPQPAGWVMLDYAQRASWPPLATIAGARPLCITVGCEGLGKELNYLSIASVVTSEGQWLDLGRLVMS